MSIERDPESTRLRILEAAFEEMHRYGFQGMRVDRVLHQTGLKKGALYHHFPSKQTLGYAVLEELIEKHIKKLLIEPMRDFDDPLEGIYILYEQIGVTWSDEFFALGCPLNKLAQEMSPLDEGFLQRIGEFFQFWQDTLSEELHKGQKNGIVDPTVDPQDCALFIIALIEGTLGMTKIQRDRKIYERSKNELKRYLESLRAGSS